MGSLIFLFASVVLVTGNPVNSTISKSCSDRGGCACDCSWAAPASCAHDDGSCCFGCCCSAPSPSPSPSSSNCKQVIQGQDCTGNDISNQGASSVDQCCDMCAQRSGCQAFTYRWGKCWFKTSCSSSTSCADCTAGIAGPAPPPTPPGPAFAKLSGVESTSDLKTLLSPIQDIGLKAVSTSAASITVDASVQYQTILGFGGAFTEAAANNFASLSASDQEEVLTAYYAAPEDGGNGYAVGRVHMNSCDFSVASYSFDDTAGDTALTRFDMNVTHDQHTMLPFMRRAIAKAPGGVNIFASPWSPPAWMKTNGRMTGSGDPGLRDEDQAAWALYFSKFFTAYRANGVNLWGLTVQNEPGYAAPWEACKYSAAQERDFVKNHLGPVMRRDHPDAKIMVLDHNRDMVPEWTSTIFGDAETTKYVDGLALHWYDSKSSQMYANVEAAYDQYLSKLPGSFILGTEACNCPGVRLRDWDRAWSIASDILGDLNAWAVGWTDWNLIVDHQGGPNHLGNFCDANIIADPGQVLGAGTVIKQVSYYLMGHFSRYLRPGMMRVKSDTTVGVSVTAFRHPTTKQTAVVIMNGQNDPVQFSLNDKVSGRSATGLAIPARSIQTYVYTAEPTPNTQVIV